MARQRHILCHAQVQTGQERKRSPARAERSPPAPVRQSSACVRSVEHLVVEQIHDYGFEDPRTGPPQEEMIPVEEPQREPPIGLGRPGS